MEHATQGAEDLIKAASSLAPYLSQQAQRTESQRQVPLETVDRLREANLFQILVPKSYGGFEHDFSVLGRVIAELGVGCGATAWVYGVSAMHNWVVATFPKDAQDEVRDTGPQAVISGSYAPNPKQQRAELVAGGFRLSGKWGFASGCDHAGWHLIQFLSPPSVEGPPIPTYALVPKVDFSIEDDWNVMGLAGTGSKTVVLDNIFVPAHRTLAYLRMNSGNTPGATLHHNPIYAMPFMSVVPVSISCPVLGMARGALNNVLGGAGAGERDSAVRGKFADHVMAHNWIGEAMASIDAASLVIHSSLETLARIARQGLKPTQDERVRIRRDYAFGVRLSVQAVQALLNCSGASGIVLDHPVQRAWRDVNAAARHLGLNWEPYAIQSGRSALGLDPKGLF